MSDLPRIVAASIAVAATAFFLIALAALDVQGITYLGGWLGYSLIGAFLASRQPRNAIGWLFAVIGLSSLIGFVAEEQTTLVAALFPDRVVAAFAGFWFVSFDLLPALLILFPDGRPPSRRWSPAVWIIMLALPIGVLSSGDPPEAAAIAPVLAALFGWDAATAAVSEMQGVVLLGPPMLLLGVLALVSRARGAGTVQRQQLKWFTWAAGLLALTFAATYAIFMSPLRALDPSAPYPVALFGGIPFVIGLVSIPIAATVAILRYRLYDIDIVINRTIVYTALTALLAGTYVGSVLVAQRLAGAIAGGNEVGVAASTLVVVGLFQPLRRRIQSVVDRRFYRSRYDAQLALDAFSARLRDQVQLDDVRRQLISAVHATVQPRAVNVWLRSPFGALPRASVGASEVSSPRSLGRNDLRTPDR